MNAWLLLRRLMRWVDRKYDMTQVTQTAKMKALDGSDQRSQPGKKV